MKTTITIADGQIHLSIINYETEKRDDMIIPIPPNIEHDLIVDKYVNQITNGLKTLIFTTL
jgi:hypothetical protein